MNRLQSSPISHIPFSVKLKFAALWVLFLCGVALLAGGAL